MKKSITLCSLIFFSGVVSAQDYILSCDDSRLLFPKQALSTDDNLDVVADRSEITTGDTYLLTGNVSLNSSAYYLAADEITIKKTNKTSTAKGGVKYQDNELMFIGDSAVVKKQADNNHVTLQQVQFHYPETKINGRATQVVNDGTKQVFDSVSYSLCPLGNTDWQMKADKITLNSNTNRGVASDVVVEFLGVPVFYSPHHEWVLEGRGSGFLAPAFGSYNESTANQGSNYQVRIPYYFNIAPDRDFLLTLNQLSSRGSIVEGKYRQLIAANNYLDESRFEIEGHYLNEDDITKNKRWLLNSSIDLILNEKTELNVTTNRVSDKDYFKEIAHSNTSDSALNSHIDLTFNDADQDLKLNFFAESEQLVNYDTSGDASYTRAPELSISKGFVGLDNRRMDLSLVSTKFTHKTSSSTGIRTHAQANFNRSITTDVYSLTPKLSLSTTDYALDNAVNESRSIYSFGLDSKLFLEREVNLFGTDLIQTLTPRLAYNYTPEKTDPSVNFDSESKSDSYESLFSGQKFTGIDRIGKANDLTFGLESDFIDEETGETYLSLKSAQTYYSDAISTNNGTRKYSDIVMSADIGFDSYTFNNSLQYDPETNKIDKRDSSMSYILNPRKFLTLAHHYDGTKKSAELYGAYPLTQNIHVFAGINRSITDSITNKETTGIAYESCCWALRLAHFKKYMGSGNGYDYVTNFELVLKGLATTSPGLAARLEEEVPNYLANLNDI
ncbi:Outer membrane protein Imp, required for envelope biogenesis / Organic solvent tolerance protein precursor [Bathymodiolus heckerae thiotrophic gill symbiont]|uniref:LPS-assembly protein LptD n=1 Tax=Bathymodiolus heckerae thiotrophic gill symbiont TaxID=1052212 RepID=UPI0010B80ED0|nr:LPS assembly protein LptD [Bathymodiolus heckerae thiotrophic gill symbiont]SHN90446.1 Outer membrane protein Imp, required for envelope biogenesis / Organic solvent tolerance protein precursor [Bathymodiolus heckerae thiotrophic gill symbiont]